MCWVANVVHTRVNRARLRNGFGDSKATNIQVLNETRRSVRHPKRIQRGRSPSTLQNDEVT